MKVRMVTRISGIVLGGALLWFLASAQEKKPALTEKMHELQQALEDLYANAIKTQRNESKAQNDQYGKSLQQFSKLALSVAKPHQNLRSIEGQNLDASLQEIGALFADDVDLAVRLYQKNQIANSRRLAMGIGHYCISCHTASNRGFSFVDATVNKFAKDMSPFERAEYFAATRCFDAAIDEYRKIIENPANAGDLDWVTAVRRSMMIAIRYKAQPQVALQLVQGALSNPNVPVYFERDAGKWKRGIESWMREGNPELENEKQLFSKSQRLLDTAEKRRAYPADRGADVDFLRLTAAAHTFLDQFPSSQHKAEVLYFLGKGYEALADLNLWPLHLNYYAACVRTSPKSAIAQQCYQSYEKSLYTSYTGSGGTEIPTEELKRLRGLKKSAQ